MEMIKVRAWNSELNEMWDADKLVLSGIYLATSGVGLVDTHDDLKRLKHLTPLLFTGRKDSEGREVYAGDVVTHKFKRIWKTELHTSTVVWDAEWGRFYLNDGVSNHKLREDMIYQVIGNIYEK
jgi:hypothetical protein